MDQNSTPETPGGAAPGGTGLAPNVAAALAYVPSPVTGVIMYFLESNPFVRFHAWQSIWFGIAWGALWQVLGAIGSLLLLIPFLGWLAVLISGLIAGTLLGLLGFLIWLVLVVQAFGNNRFKLPVVGNLAERYAANDGPHARGALAYVLGPITGFVLLQRDRDPFVRFHSWQSIIFVLGFIAVGVVFGILSVPVSGYAEVILQAAQAVISVGFLYFWLTALDRAGKGEMYKLPFVGDLAQQYASR